MGIDATRLLERAVEMQDACRFAEGNPGLELGLRLGSAASVGLSSDAGSFGLWMEQLVAESTGKQGQGIVPAPDDPHAELHEEVALPSPYELGQEFFRWEFAVAVAGSMLGINPFDQPDVQAAKDKTNEVLAQGDVELEPEGSLDELLAQATDGDYVCIQAFVDPARAADVEPLIDRARESGHIVTHGLGPRYLHSTGQLHKGGPKGVLCLQVVDDQGDELPIPGRDFGFARLIRAQAAGDYESLKERGRRVARVRLGGGRLMQLGMIGLGRMGGNMTTRLTQHGHDVKTFDPGVDSTAKTLAELRDQLDAPRAFWSMIPAGKITEDAFQELLELGDEGDTIVDGGNSNFRDSQRRYREAKEKGIHFVDAGVSGGIWGLRERLLPDGRRRRRAGAAAASRSSPRSLPRTATHTSARAAQVTSRRWSTTASSTG